MMKKVALSCLLTAAIATLSSLVALPQSDHVKSVDFDWKFYAGEVAGAELTDFDDSQWREVNLPHDWSIEGEFSKDNPAFSRGAWLPGGKVVYRKSFIVPEAQKGKRFVIYFDGAYRNSEVYINGQLLGKRPLGYIAFHYDMTEHMRFGPDRENVLTVKLDNSNQPGSRWYTGTGIYRHVDMVVTDKIYVPVWGNQIVANELSEDRSRALFKLNTTVANDRSENQNVILRHLVNAPDGRLVHRAETNKKVGSGTSELVVAEFEIENPQLWEIENPHLYTVTTQLWVNGKNIYEETNRAGIRELEFSGVDGFKLNGEHIKLKGVCLHHAGGPLGAAIHRRTIERQLEKLREMGCNAVRTAHNPFSEEFLDVCDEMGFLVMNEMFDEWEVVKEPMTVQNGTKIRIPVDFYAKQFKEWADRDLTDFVMRDRNHPSVIMWSIGNEIDQMRTEEGIPIANRLAKIVHDLDDRPVTNGVNGYGWGVWPNAEAVKASDVLGYNYIKADGFDKEREMNPNAPVVVTEHESAQSFYPRATYLYDENGSKTAWWNRLGYEASEGFEWVEKRDIRGESGMDAWKWVKAREHVMGMFIWTGWDYLGETIPFGWPARSSSFAPIDLAGFPKDGFYFYQSQWTDEPMVHLFPHWNLDGMEGETVSIYGFTNGDEVELFVNGKSMGKQPNDRSSVEYQSWDVVYEPGELKAVAYRDGKKVATNVVKTAGKPAKIKAETRRKAMQANGQDLIYVECTIVDKKGNPVPTANHVVKFSVEGPATIAGVGNGDNMGLEPFKANQRSAFHGNVLVILQSTRDAGKIKLRMQSEGLKAASLTLRSK